MSNQEALEAAKAIWGGKPPRGLRAALAAAAPFIAAEAWDDAMKNAAEIAWEHDASASSAISTTLNPYRSQA